MPNKLPHALSLTERKHFKTVVKTLEERLGMKTFYVHKETKSGWYSTKGDHKEFHGRNKVIAYHKLTEKYDRFLN